MNILSSKLIVIKIGSSTLVDQTDNFNNIWINKLIDDVHFLIEKKIKIIIVTSGAIALGCKILKKINLNIFSWYHWSNYFRMILISN